jgi:hypothetical protein
MNEEQVKQGFLGVQRGHGKEVHGVKSLANRLLTSRQSIRKALANKELHFEKIIDHGHSVAFQFDSTYLDEQRRAMVDEICARVRAETKRLTPNEHEILLTQLHTLRGVKKDVETEFAQPSDDNDDDTVASLLGKTVIGGAAVGGGALGVNALRKRGKALNEAGTTVVGSDVSAGGKVLSPTGGGGFIMNPESRFTLPVAGASKGFLGDTKAGISDVIESLLKRVPKEV